MLNFGFCMSLFSFSLFLYLHHHLILCWLILPHILLFSCFYFILHLLICRLLRFAGIAQSLLLSLSFSSSLAAELRSSSSFVSSSHSFLSSFLNLTRRSERSADFDWPQVGGSPHLLPGELKCTLWGPSRKCGGPGAPAKLGRPTVTRKLWREKPPPPI